jgi:hypothetical protein
VDWQARLDSVTRTARSFGLRLQGAAARATRWLAPRAGQAISAAGRGTSKGGQVALSAAWQNRRVMMRGLYRALWWAALLMMFVVGKSFLSGQGETSLVEQAHLWFAAGLAASAIVLTVAVEKRMRWAAFLLGAGHGTLALVAWVVQV